ncbi:MAG TPA: AAA family ATPase, partial [Candidatus Syntrophosphaera sp.]|nr:AAA family ATPase [Candidatus Syntrophosphaera sp.]
LEAETGIESTTLSSFLRRRAHEDGRILVFDEASMLDSRNAAKLFKIAEQHHDRIILVGDRNQLQSIGAGRVFERLVADCELAGDLISLNENFRQRNEDLKKAVDLARKGQMKDSLSALDKRGAIIEIEESKRRREIIAGLYNKDTLIIAGTAAAKDELNSLIRARLAAAGALKHGINYKLGRADKDGIEHEREITISKGETITFTRNEYKNYDIRNGERAKVLECGERSIIVETEDNRKLEINPEKYKGIDYGYALTTYKAQGQTYNSVVVESDTHTPALVDMRNQYVNITRARDNVKIYTDDKEQLQELAEIRTYSRDTISCEQTFKAKDRLAELENRVQKGNTIEQIEIYNEAAVAPMKEFIKDVPEDEMVRKDLKKAEVAMEAVKKQLNASKLSAEKMQAIADVLNDPQNAGVWKHPDITTAEDKIAAARLYLEPEKEKEILNTIEKDHQNLVQAEAKVLHHGKKRGFEMEM